MDPLFKKAMVLTDLHFGRSGNSIVALQDNMDCLAWAMDKALTWGAETCIFMGDWFDNRHSLNPVVVSASLDAMDALNAAFPRSYWFPGNHDLPFREKRDAASIEFARNLPNIKIIRDPLTVDGVTFLPWLVGDEHKTIKNLKSRYVFGHLEMAGFLLNSRVEMPDGEHVIKPDQFVGQEYVFTGHFHLRQSKRVGNTTVSYIGNPMPHNFTDAWDSDRGIMLLEWGKDPIFVNWDEAPLYRTVKLSELVADPDKYLKPKMTVRATMDIVLGYEEMQELRDTLLSAYGLRKLELVHPAKVETEQEFEQQVVYQSVDQIVEEGLKALDSAGLSKERLIEIYRSLAAD